MTGTIRVRRDGLLPFLRDRAADRPRRPAPPEGLCVLSGGIVARNLTGRLAAESLPPDLVRTTTVEELAGDLVAADRGRPATVLDRPVRKRAIASVLSGATDRDTPLGRFARRVPFESPDALEAVAGELNEYHRCTDAASDPGHGSLVGVVDDVADDNPFAAEATRESVRAFRALDRCLRDLVGDQTGGSGGTIDGDERVAGAGSAVETKGVGDGADRFVSRSHLVRAARGCLPDAWAEATGDPDWVAVASVSALDNPTTRLLLSVAGTGTAVHLFAGAGTAGYFRRRLGAAVEEPSAPGGIEVRGPAPGPRVESDAGAALLSAAADHEAVRSPPGVRAVAAPDRRREVEYAVRAARRAPGSTLLVARDAREYETPLRDVALTSDRPFRVETRREVRSVPAYRALLSAVEVLAAAEAGAVSPRDLLDPLQRGFVLPTNDGRTDGSTNRRATAREGWPVPPSAVQALRDRLGRGTDPERPVAAWREVLGDGDGGSEASVDVEGDRTADPTEIGLALLDWVAAHRDAPPADGPALRDFLARLLDALADAARDRDRRRVGGIAVETGRARAAEKHPAYYVDRVREALPGAVEAHEFLRDALDRPADWSTALAALRHGTGAESYGRPADDGTAVEVVDAGNAHFRRADRVFVLGLAAERFPRGPRRPAFVRGAVRDAVYRRASDHPFLYLDGEAAGYGRDLDAYEAALRTAREGVTLVRPYKDLEGRDVPHSPFLDAVDLDPDARRRIDLGDWVGIGAAHRDGSTDAAAGGPGRGAPAADGSGVDDPDGTGTRRHDGSGADDPDGTGTRRHDGSGAGDVGGRTDGSAADPSPEDWDDLWAALPPKDRLRALARYADRPAGRGPDADELERLAARVDDPDVRRRVRRRVARFRDLLEEDDE
ncbi:hypothetical protein BRD00_05670 [Halobacteriales archaeon QS_8_69_26]|nr:MAG: hypothetical protein BRD00_05670 [Halobacteriales archaeon QS_8_69_26]